MADICKLIATNPLVGKSLQDAMQTVPCQNADPITEEPVQVKVAASEADIACCVHLYLPQDNIKKETLTQSKQLRKFMSHHSSSTA